MVTVDRDRTRKRGHRTREKWGGTPPPYDRWRGYKFFVTLARTDPPTGAKNCSPPLSYRRGVRDDDYTYFAFNFLGLDTGVLAALQLMQLVVPPRLTREPRGERGSLKIYKCAGGPCMSRALCLVTILHQVIIACQPFRNMHPLTAAVRPVVRGFYFLSFGCPVRPNN